MKIEPIILETTPSMWDPEDLGIEGFTYDDWELRHPQGGESAWRQGPSVFQVSRQEWRTRVIIVTQPSSEYVSPGKKAGEDKLWAAFLAQASKLAGSKPRIEHGDAFFNLPSN